MLAEACGSGAAENGGLRTSVAIRLAGVLQFPVGSGNYRETNPQ